MPSLRTETSHLLLYDPDKSRSIVHCYLSRPSPLEERMLGRLFFLVEIDNRDDRNLDVIRGLQETMNKAYYESEDFQVEAAFERALQKTNERLPVFIPEGLEEWVGKLNIVIGVLKETALNFTVVGRVHAFLIHQQRIVDILESSSASGIEPVSPLKVFSNIISGQLNFHDTVFFCTSSVLDYLSQEKIKRIIAEHNPHEATQTLEGLLGDTDGAAAFGAVLLSLVPALEEVRDQETESAENGVPLTAADLRSQRSMEQLITREEKTNELLTHSLWPNLGRLMKKGVQAANTTIIDRFRRKSRQKGDEKEKEPSMPDRESVVARASERTEPRQSFGKILLSILTAIGGALAVLIRGIAGVFRHRSPPRERFRNLPSHANRSLAGSARWFERLSPARRRLLLIGFVLIILFLQSVVATGRHKDSSEQKAIYRSSITTAQEKVNAADAALLIQNESGARKLLLDASDAIAKIPASEKSLKNDVASVKASIEQKISVLRHIVTIQPTMVIDLGGLDVGLTARSIATVGDDLLTFNEKTNTLYRINLQTKKSEILVSAPSLDSGLLMLVPNTSASIYLLQKNGAFQELNLKEKTLASLIAQFENAQRDIRSAVVYNNRLYALDALNGQIVRFQKAARGFGSGSNWLTDATADIKGSVGMAIDGAIYVLKGTGDILKLAVGKKDTAVFDPVDPALQKPVTVFTTQATTNLYILDPENKRILEFEKTGKFLRQYVADQLTNLKDMVVVDKTLYVLSGTVVYSFLLTETSSQ